MTTSWKTLGKLAGVVLGLYVAGKLLLVFIVLAFVLVFCTPGWKNDQQVYLRNYTGQPMQVELTVPRSAVTVDTVWWGLAESGSAIGRAIVVKQLVIRGRPYPLKTPLLLPGTADTLLVEEAPGIVKLLGYTYFNPWADLPLWTERMSQPIPAFGRGGSIMAVRTPADSLRLQLLLAPDSTFWVATLGAGLRHSDPDESWVTQDFLKPVVSWRDHTGRQHREPFPAGEWLLKMESVQRQRGNVDFHLAHYVDYK
ncbi:hypothetical protein [Hymenobacter rubripertinctus]|uniref:Uncharacterized protein n=1 Tax=Hymenobacter rubripertinctus TaxID=2029981 RepID=A0A418R6S1_9BACT|nr:hypothetical protein [Hymenobacter rubripertinctus]RIY13015.1 hypothetical protein D0T11_04615 [Hymenobacter rubripertinctus]